MSKYNWGPGYSTRDMQAGRRVITDSGPARDPIKPTMIRAVSKRAPNVPSNPARDEEGDEGDDFVERAMHGDLSRPRNPADGSEDHVRPAPRWDSRGLPPGDAIDRRYLGQLQEAHQQDQEAREKRHVSIVFGEPSRNESRDMAADWVRAVLTDKNQPHRHATHEFNKRALSTAVPADGGYMIPPGYVAMLVRDPAPFTSLDKMATRIPVEQNIGVVPTLVAKPQISYGTELEALTATDIELGQASYSLKPRGSYIPMTMQVIQDSSPALLSTVETLIMEALIEERDRSAAYGSGSGQPTGLYQSSGITDVAGITAINWANLNKMFWKVDSRHHQDPSLCWTANQNVISAIDGMVDNQGRPLLKENPREGSPLLLFGKPIVISPAFPNTYIGFGCVRYYHIFDRGILVLDSSNSAGAETWLKQQLLVRISERTDAKYIGPPTSTAFVRSKILAGIT
ncbi:MAG: phage major capsid protein [Planctomycetia bacterium]|nr:phage major capsid protein [Planctomycetia bacterium]